MYDVVTIGTATRDVFLRSPEFKAIKDPHFTSATGFPGGAATCFVFGGKMEVSEVTFTTGGGSTNAATTFARRGFSVASVFATGRDEAGKAIVAELKSEKVLPVVTRVKDLKTAYSTIMLSEGGERTILVYRGAADAVKRFSPEKFLPKWAYIVPGDLPFKKIKTWVDKLKEGGTRVAMNPSSHYVKMGAEKLRPILDKLDLVILNREEAAYLTGSVYEDEAGIFKKMDEMIKGIAVVTDGPRGVVVSDGKNIYKAGVFPEKLVDRTGAGDAFGSGFVAGLLESEKNKTKEPVKGGVVYGENDIKYAIRLASANATSVVERIGAYAGILDRAQFEDEERWKNLEIEIKLL